MNIRNTIVCMVFTCLLYADPCGMVPPIHTTGNNAITRIGLQKTYVFYKDGLQTVVIRPGFSGKVDQFGMLIPFPSPPSLRKVPDNIFEHIAASIDPPEVVVNVNRRLRMLKETTSQHLPSSAPLSYKNEVKVLKQEAVGMYEVTVLEAGSAAALKRWMDQHGYRYPTGMDKACEDYVALGWCFVAVKTRVGQKQGVAARPGMRNVNSKLPKGSSFDGHVQGMGFRFYTKKMVVPMRLSAFNGDNFRNIVYILTDKPCAIEKIPTKFVRRQISGEKLYNNLTKLLPVRIIGRANRAFIERRVQEVRYLRNPQPRNGLAAELYSADLLALREKKLEHDHEEQEKALLRISENLLLRGKAIDKLHGEVIAKQRQKIVEFALEEIKNMTLTVVDGDFPKEVIANHNLSFRRYEMSSTNNNTEKYDAKKCAPGGKMYGELFVPQQQPKKSGFVNSIWFLLGGLFLLLLCKKFPRMLHTACVLVLCTAIFAPNLHADNDGDEVYKLIQQLDDYKKTSSIMQQLVKMGQKAVPHLLGEAVEGSDMVQRGWAIVCLSQIGGSTVDAHLQNIHQNQKQPMLVRTWAIAARIQMTQSLGEVMDMSQHLSQFPALERPIGKRVMALLASEDNVSAEKLLGLAQRMPKLQGVLGKVITGLDSKELVQAMATAKDQQVRRLAAGYLASMAQNNNKIPYEVASVYEFKVDAKDVPWANGPLFVPGLRWDRESSRTLVGSLISWHLWCERKGKKAEQRQIHNNIRSLSLAQAAGYESPAWNEIGTDQWLLVWGKAVGQKELLRLLKEQNVQNEKRYIEILKQLSQQKVQEREQW
ncbi:DUF2330 domain-containing protein [Candidatus Uabimicrobium amorphum]|uniref:Uncharacterized protein n=1 Tax=Uabimicrobium amorphum TaxID=2596890 RepID=A0A5S9IHN9_UABAM|nr:DUF2330 domain-containing protein [Candidatus Uabimicrobium amorphum]BBM82009.1 hypothetical protein UABAM_00352 [Candidatus Uabimicrobium amorphum]